MDKVTVKKDELVEVLKRNREKHRGRFLRSMEGYRKTVIELLDEAIQDAKDGKEIRTSFRVERPFDMTKEYDIAIAMVEWEVGEEVIISVQGFRQYVKDDWSWSNEFSSTASLYCDV